MIQRMSIAVAITVACGMALVRAENAFAEREGHGGDPIEISAVPYPDMPTLRQAMDYVESRLAAVDYPESLKKDAIEEMRSLDSKGKYKMLPALIILGPGAGPEGYRIPKDVDKFISLGVMTYGYKGSTLYYAERVLKYEVPALAKTLLHDIFHNVLAHSLSNDEDLVHDLTESVFKGRTTPALQLAVRRGLYIKKRSSYTLPSIIRTDQFLDALNVESILHLIPLTEPYRAGVLTEAKVRSQILARLPAYLDNWSVEGLARVLNVESSTCRYFDHGFCSQREVIVQRRILELARELNPSNPWVAHLETSRTYQWGCKDYISYWRANISGCRNDRLITAKDLFNFELTAEDDSQREIAPAQ